MWIFFCLVAPRQIVWPLREHTRVRQYPPGVTAIKMFALFPGVILTSKSGESLNRPQPGLTTHNCDMMFISISAVSINRWQSLSTCDSYYQLSPLLSIKPGCFYQPARPLLSTCRKRYSPISSRRQTYYDQHMTPVNPTYCKLWDGRG